MGWVWQFVFFGLRVSATEELKYFLRLLLGFDGQAKGAETIAIVAKGRVLTRYSVSYFIGEARRVAFRCPSKAHLTRVVEMLQNNQFPSFARFDFQLLSFRYYSWDNVTLFTVFLLLHGAINAVRRHCG